ncbi:DUF4236 domain-containing protein [Sporolactobacillus shoreicorticis]|uniref:DUF4236 domain-containing protein n=1 Tax=Sporolactobacillus shoreicorticis TaxID=1923877 RepID=A0ABW5S6S3_9BACL|nr:DUF4236 domain-containing protein [Sporolactobacillus shoreicorticis]MCO7127761.1 DUF4236 domain-containing protein [Sporolactobacillus shoreicorticis]
MGFRFRKSIKIAPGIKFNINKKSVGMTFGTKGAHYTINSKGTRTKSVGILGTGLSYVDVKNPSKKESKSLDAASPTTRKEAKDENKKGCGIGCLSLLAIILIVIALANLFTGHFNNFFGVLLFSSVILTIASAFKPTLAFWTKKKTRGRAVIGYVILSIIFMLAVGATAGEQSASDKQKVSGESTISKPVDSSESSVADSSSVSDSSSSETNSDESDSSISESKESSSSSANADSSSEKEDSKSAAHMNVAPSKPSKEQTKKTETKPKKSASKAPSASKKTSKTETKSATTKPAESKPAPSVSVVSHGLNVSPGQNASVTVKGEPGAHGSIQVVYNSGPSTAAGLGPKTADGNGNITWVWKVGTRTAPGDYPVTITIGGKTISQTLHVQ